MCVRLYSDNIPEDEPEERESDMFQLLLAVTFSCYLCVCFLCVCVCVDVVDTLTVDPALLLIVVGSLMFLITFLGCFGALRNATCLLKTV